jgi:hypothetical protein
MTRCVRGAHLLAKVPEDRKAWIEQRLQELAQIFAVGVGGFSVMDNHLHVLLRLDPDVASGWSDEEVVRRWGTLFPPRDKSRQPLPVCDNWVQWCLADVRWVKTIRERLQSLSWFMKCLKEPLARLANRQDEARGAFFEKRFKGVAVLDEEALLAVCAYTDLNPVATGVVQVPEASPHTSIKTRVEHVQKQGRTSDLAAATGVPGTPYLTRGVPPAGSVARQPLLGAGLPPSENPAQVLFERRQEILLAQWSAGTLVCAQGKGHAAESHGVLKRDTRQKCFGTR